MAKTTGVLDGAQILAYIDDVLISCLNGVSANFSTATSETTCRTENGAETIQSAGAQTWAPTAQGNLRHDAINGFSTLWAAWKAKTQMTVRIATSNTDDPYWEGDVIITSLDLDAPEGVATFNVAFGARGEVFMFNT